MHSRIGSSRASARLFRLSETLLVALALTATVCSCIQATIGYAKARQAGKLGVEELEARAEAAYKKGQFAVAAQCFSDAAESAPDRRDLVLSASIAYERAEDFDRAIQYCQAFIDNPGQHAGSREKALVRLEFLKNARAQGGVPILFESADDLQIFARQVGAVSITEVLGWPIAKFGGSISKEKEQEDTRPHLAMYRARPDVGRQITLWLYFNKNRLYRVGRDFPCTRSQVEAEVARSPGAYASVLQGGNTMVEVKLGRLVERIILPVGEEPKCEWWLYDLMIDRDLYKKEMAVFEAYGWNDAGVMALAPPASFSNAEINFGNALKAMPRYAAAASRWCAAILELGPRDAAHALSVCSIGLKSEHRMYRNRAKRAIQVIRSW